ncbi:Formyltetrahydrofolate deformylase [Sandaracinus amylolyticus]|uniref:Formyltetrahydrofolate deformylase n=1 Tax=Sandaracinus amylolyticus TaxID=927083 RepID=A0A0F6YG54_9BACT|nr:Formyltetrahydrofolate deformylase [Sandaracinus amylolyticus]
MTIATLLVSGPDRPGLVAALAQVLYGHGANILDADQHSDPEASWFFQRIRFDQRELRTDATSLRHAIAEVSERLGMTWRLESSARRKKVAIFVSKYDHCLFDLLWRHRAGELDCDVARSSATIRISAPSPRSSGFRSTSSRSRRRRRRRKRRRSSRSWQSTASSSSYSRGTCRSSAPI